MPKILWKKILKDGQIARTETELTEEQFLQAYQDVYHPQAEGRSV